MEAQILTSENLKDRKEILKQNAVKTENFTYPKALDELEISNLKSEMTKNYISLAKHDEAKKEFMVDHKANIKPLQSAVNIQMAKIRTQIEEVTEEVFLLADHEAGLMGYYNATGKLVYSRPLMPEERQFSIVDATYNITGTNN
ncbi:hypothetical protein Phi39:1_gp37 [Cellulophaga phage phi39:1]|uniref:hypothetical protein n=1 Tax=Cellulophaga phage phi39:1 TaxID=1327993 RepID=UPI0003518151|nr:hypothetical protein Phi39:1_gp37 [Cellulophaga phage phi39:1]AGO49152.1 hypothetical protein Phi39:1_gp37 [Cellulophaga phage phi39:1]